MTPTVSGVGGDQRERVLGPPHGQGRRGDEDREEERASQARACHGQKSFLEKSQAERVSAAAPKTAVDP